MSRRALAAAMLVVVLAVSACAPAARSTWQPQPWPAAAVSLTAEPPPIDLAADSRLAAALEPLRVRNDAVGVQVRAALLPGSPAATALNGAVESRVRGAIDARSAATGAAYTPSVFPRGTGLGDRDCLAGSTTRTATELLADPALGPNGGVGTAVVCDIVVASGSLLGQRLRVVTGTPDAVTEDSTTILYADIETGEVVTADALWTDAAAPALTAEILELLRRNAGSLSLASPTASADDPLESAIRAALATTVVVDDGLVLTIPAGVTSPQLTSLGVEASAEPFSVTIPPDIAGPLLSPFGQRALAASGQSFDAAAVVRDPAVRPDCTLVTCVALTFDDGPSEFTAGILDELDRRGALATFFAMGEKAAPYREILTRMTAEGHEVGNHTWNHPHLPTLLPAQITAQIADSSRALADASGQPMRMFRPPYGEFNPSVLQAAGLPAILWDVDTLDWQGPADDVLLSRAVDQPGPGSIVLMHDLQPGTARNAGAIIDGLLDRGFTLVTVEQLFDGVLPSSGAWRHGP